MTGKTPYGILTAVVEFADIQSLWGALADAMSGRDTLGLGVHYGDDWVGAAFVSAVVASDTLTVTFQAPVAVILECPSPGSTAEDFITARADPKFSRSVAKTWPAGATGATFDATDVHNVRRAILDAVWGVDPQYPGERSTMQTVHREIPGEGYESPVWCTVIFNHVKQQHVTPGVRDQPGTMQTHCEGGVPQDGPFPRYGGTKSIGTYLPALDTIGFWHAYARYAEYGVNAACNPLLYATNEGLSLDHPGSEAMLAYFQGGLPLETRLYAEELDALNDFADAINQSADPGKDVRTNTGKLLEAMGGTVTVVLPEVDYSFHNAIERVRKAVEAHLAASQVVRVPNGEVVCTDVQALLHQVRSK